MANSFECHSNDVKSNCYVDNYYLGCRECGSEIEIFNNDCKYSYHRHRKSAEHLEFIENFTKSENLSDDTYRIADYFTFIENFISRNEIFNIDIGLDGEDEIFPVLELKKETFYSTYCNLCRSIVPNTDFKAQKRDEIEHVFTRAIVKHFESGLHQWNCMNFNSNKRYVKRIPSTYMFECMLCKVSMATDRLGLHFKSLEHKEKLKVTEVLYMEALNISGKLCHPVRNRSCGCVTKSSNCDADEFSIWENKMNESDNTYKISELDTIFIGTQNNEVRCVLCDMRLISLKNTIAHMRGNFHRMMKKLFRVNCRCVQWYSSTEVSCVVCSGNFSLKKFLDHCEEDFHRQEYAERTRSCREMKLDQAFVAVGEYFIDASKYGISCGICRVQCIGVEGLIRHFTFKHKITPEGSLDSLIDD